MRFAIIAAAGLLAVPAAAADQASAWGYFEAGGGAGIGVQAPDGTQLMLKCDKPGAGSVYALIARKAMLVPPSQTPVMRVVRVRYDDKTPYDDHWRFLENTAMAVNKGNERSLTRLLSDLGASRSLELMLYYDPKDTPMTLKFDVAGGKPAVEQVFAKCKDTIPTS